MKRIEYIYLKMFRITALTIGIGNLSTNFYSVVDENFMRENNFFDSYYSGNHNTLIENKIKNLMFRTFILCSTKSVGCGMFWPIIIPIIIVGFFVEPKKQFMLTFTPGSEWM